jgi:hypothetical protein
VRHRRGVLPEHDLRGPSRRAVLRAQRLSAAPAVLSLVRDENGRHSVRAACRAAGRSRCR